MDPTILFSSAPNLEELCFITVRVPTNQVCNSQVKQHILTCRTLIYTEPDIIASPSLDMDDSFFVIMQRSAFTTGSIQNRLRHQGLEVGKAQRVHPPIYQACLNYTANARLAPLWNKAGDWFIQGRNFLSHCGYANGIQMKLSVNKEEIYISLLGAVVKSPPLELEDIELCERDISNLLRCSEEEGETSPVPISEFWCRVLPSLKKGQITSLALTLPRESPFQTYKQLKAYWKNMYGYRLPDTDEATLYYQVRFLPNERGQLFTYPGVCLRRGPVQRLPRVDHKPILQAFLQDFHREMDTVCAMRLRFQPKLRYPTATLHPAIQDSGLINLSSKPPHKAPLRKPEPHFYRDKPSKVLLFSQRPHKAVPSTQNSPGHLPATGQSGLAIKRTGHNSKPPGGSEVRSATGQGQLCDNQSNSGEGSEVKSTAGLEQLCDSQLISRRSGTFKGHSVKKTFNFSNNQVGRKDSVLETFWDVSSGREPVGSISAGTEENSSTSVVSALSSKSLCETPSQNEIDLNRQTQDANASLCASTTGTEEGKVRKKAQLHEEIQSPQNDLSITPKRTGKLKLQKAVYRPCLSETNTMSSPVCAADTTMPPPTTVSKSPIPQSESSSSTQLKPNTQKSSNASLYGKQNHKEDSTKLAEKINVHRKLTKETNSHTKLAEESSVPSQGKLIPLFRPKAKKQVFSHSASDPNKGTRTPGAKAPAPGIFQPVQTNQQKDHRGQSQRTRGQTHQSFSQAFGFLTGSLQHYPWALSVSNTQQKETGYSSGPRSCQEG